MAEKRYSYEFLLTAAEVNSQREMPLSRLVTTIIDVATGHANQLGIGFDRMIREGISWVLSRLTVDFIKAPSVNRTYRMATWIESTNRLFSERNFEMTDVATGEVIVRVHSIWMAVNMSTRRPGDLSPLWEGFDLVDGTPVGIEKGGKLLPLTSGERELTYRFAVSDIDVNRHVTTRRYIDLITDIWPLEVYDENRINRFEVAFKHEARYGETATVISHQCKNEQDVSDVQISVGDTVCCLARIRFETR